MFDAEEIENQPFTLDPIKIEPIDIDEYQESTNREEPATLAEALILKSGKVDTGGKFFCRACRPAQPFSNFQILQQHIKDEHNGEFKFCRKCNLKFPAAGNQFAKHLKTHEISFVCKECKLKTSNKQQYVKHMLTTHAPKEEPQRETFLKAHDMHHPCSKCNHIFHSAEQLKSHEEKSSTDSCLPPVQPSEENFHKCYICKALFKTNKLKFEHIVKDHAKTDTTCKKCNFQSTSVIRFEIHMKSHDEKVLNTCNICNYRTPSQVTLKNHIYRVHVKGIVYTCDFCGNRYTQRESMLRHMRKKHIKN